MELLRKLLTGFIITLALSAICIQLVLVIFFVNFMVTLST